MALSIGVTTGCKIDVGSHVVRVKAIFNPALLVLTVDDGPEITVTDKERVCLMPEVYVFAGVGATGQGNRLAFEAPRRIVIHKQSAAEAAAK